MYIKSNTHPTIANVIMDERASKREVVDLEVSAALRGQSFRALVYDLSIDGCIIASNGEPQFCAGDTIHLDLPHAGSIAGTIVWVAGAAGGVQFTARLHDGVVKQLGFHPAPDHRIDFRDQFGRRVMMPPARLSAPLPSISIVQDTPEPLLREQERASITIRCEARIGLGGWNVAILLDLSTHGFQLLRAPGCVVGANVKLRIPGIEMLTANVKWMTADSIGCAFSRPLSPYVFEHLVANASRSGIESHK